MINSHILSDTFEYLEPRTVEEALQSLNQCGEKAKVMAGGTDLLVQMKMGKVHAECLININRIPSLRYLIEDKGLRIGALTSLRQVEESQKILRRYAALHEAARAVTSVQIKHMGTIGGNLCNASPASDSSIPLIAFGSKVRLARAEEERVMPLEEFFVGPGKTVLSPGELLIEVELPDLPAGTGSSFLKMGRVAADLAKISVAVMIVRKEDFCKDCRIVWGAVAEKPLRTKETEKLLRGKELSDTLLEKAGEQASQEIRPITDVRSSLWYRREVSKVLLRDAVKLAWERAL